MLDLSPHDLSRALQEKCGLSPEAASRRAHLLICRTDQRFTPLVAQWMRGEPLTHAPEFDQGMPRSYTIPGIMQEYRMDFFTALQTANLMLTEPKAALIRMHRMRM